MNRVVKTAIAVTAFGLAAAAMAVPAQAEVQYNTARYAPIDGPGAGTTAATSPLGGLLGGLVGGGLLNGLIGGSKAKSGAVQMTEAERDAASENQAEPGMVTANAAEDVTRQSGPLPELSPLVRGAELSPIVGGIPLSGGGLPLGNGGGLPLVGGSLTRSLPVLSGAARMAQPATPSVKAGRQEQGGFTVEGVAGQSSVTAALGSSVGGTVGKLYSTSLLPDSAGMTGTAKGAGTLSAETVVSGLTEAAQRALPSATNGQLSPMIGHVAPVEMSPVVEALPATSQAASMDELTPLVEDGAAFVEARGAKAAGSYSDVITALGWTTDALTSSVRDSWVRD